ncbi:MAG: 1-acyl-sn-glycerol-3-phosphate acyltransferase [Ruminococcaceae bacterium]|nr:1-acyl-sn-glycerol-3-phosphate acyltransferase [Oscillospiraceae bacterium]
MKSYKWIKLFLGWLIGLIFRVNRHNEQLQKVEGSMIICANHSSLLDPIVLAIATDRTINYMAKAELFKNKIANWFLRCLGAFPVVRGKADLTSVKTSLKILKNDGVLGIFPQGKRVEEGESADAKMGLAMLAYKTKATVLPVKIIYKTKPGFLRRTDIIYGKPLSFEELGFKDGSKEEFAQVSNKILEIINSLSLS